MEDNLKIIFMGTPDFAVPALEKIYNKYGLEAVVTIPDKPKGRGRKLMPSAVKVKAAELGLNIFQPEKLNDEDFIKEINEIKPDIICVIAFRILPQVLYEIPSLGSFNIHGSLLPKYRGAAPINWAIINGEKETGVTSFLLQKQVDTGDILLKRKISIPENATTGDLHDLLMPEAAELSIETIELLNSGDVKVQNQDDSQATQAPKIFKEDCEIKFSKSAINLKNFIHGMSPIPGAWTKFEDGSTLKILRAEITGESIPIGEYLITKKELLIGASDGALSIKELQPEGKKAMNVESYVNGWRGEPKGKFIQN